MISVEIDIESIEEEYYKERDRIERKIETIMQVAGEEYIGTARRNGSYRDRTGQLRSAPGYKVYKKDSVAVNASPNADTAALIDSEQHQADMTLVVANGKGYATYVEAKGFDVASSAELATERKITEMLESGSDE